ncbi:MAG: hypothetical protein CMI67_23665 [Pelagibaca sp.]|nr:hypothetical protein [Pelagibaca sp.]
MSGHTILNTAGSELAPGVVIAASLDTKGRQVAFLVQELDALGIPAIVIDCALRSAPSTAVPAVTASELARLAGTTIEDLRAQPDRAPALSRIMSGLDACMAQLESGGLIRGVIGLGGGTNATLGARAFAAVPYGRPKILVSTVVAGDTRPFIAGSDAVLIHSVVDFIGLGALLKASLRRAAVTMQGLLEIPFWGDVPNCPIIAMTANGATTAGAEAAEAWLTHHECETWTFHARGSGGMAYERLISEGRVTAALDFATTETADEVLGGLRSAGPTRLEAAGRAGIPQVVVPGGIDLVNFSERHTVPPCYAERDLIVHTPSSVLMRSTGEESARIGQWIGAKLAAARGPAAVLVPMRGFSSYDAPGRPHHDPQACVAFTDAVEQALANRRDIPVERHDLHINDPEFGQLACARLWELMSTHHDRKVESHDG